jgi:hypothetical protein
MSTTSWRTESFEGAAERTAKSVFRGARSPAFGERSVSLLLDDRRRRDFGRDPAAVSYLDIIAITLAQDPVQTRFS